MREVRTLSCYSDVLYGDSFFVCLSSWGMESEDKALVIFIMDL